MIHQFYKYIVDLSNYQLRDLPREIVEYNRSFERSLSTEIRRFQNELHWDQMWTIPEVYERLNKGYKFNVLRPKNQIKGWAWLATDHEIKNVYVSKWKRNQGWSKQLYFSLLNKAWELEYPDVYIRVDVWNKPAKYAVESVIGQIGCRVNCKLVEEEY